VRCFTASVILILFPGEALPQAITGTLVGTVQDATGGVIASATVTATNIETNIGQSTVTGGAGDYTIPNLPPGRYELAAQSKGFATSVVSETFVRVEQTARVDFTLSPGQTSQEVTVSALAPLVESTTSDLGHVIESREMQALPLKGRLFEQLVTAGRPPRPFLF
jgi:hypothetical protein